MNKIGEQNESMAVAKYEQNRQVAQSSELAQYVAETRGSKPEIEPVEDKEYERRNSEFMKHISEIPPAIGRGALRSVQELGNFAIEAADWAEDNLAEAGFGDGKFITEQSKLNFADKAIEAPETMTGNIVQGIAQFITPFSALNKAVKVGKGAVGAAKLVRAAGIGAAVDFTSFDPKEERLSNFLNEFPSLKSPVTEYLAANPKDTNAEGRLKNAIEGLGLGVATDFVFAGLSKGLNFYKARRMADNVKVEADEVVKQVGDVKYDELPDIEVPEREAVEQVDEGVDLPPTPDQDSMSLKIAQKVEEIKGRTSGEAKLGDLEEFPFEEIYEPVEYVVPERNIDDLINKGSYLERRDYINELVELNPELKELGITPEPNITDIPDLANIRDIGDDTVIAMIQKGAPPELIQKMINLDHKKFKTILEEAGIDPEFKLTGRDERVLAALVEYASEIDSAKGAVDLLGEAESAKGSPTKAFHGTPHEFRDFSTEAINTGEGTQWEGWGLYFSSSEGTANWYRKMLSGSDKKGHTYRVELPARNELIHRDKRFSEQPKAIQEKLLALRENIKNTVGQGDFKSQPRALQILDAMEEGPMRLFVQNLEELFGSDKAVSQFLNNNGIKGFEYFGESSANFVIFDDKNIETILRTAPDMIPPELPLESMTKQAINKKANQIRQRLKEKRWTQQEPPPIPKFEDVVVGEGDRAVNINLDKIQTSDDVAKVLKSTADQMAGEIDEARRGVVTDAEREALAENLGMSINDVMELERGQALNAEELRAANNLLSASAQTVFDLAKKIQEGDDSTGMKALILEAWDKHRIIQAKVSGAIAEAGRALRAMKADVQIDGAAKNRYLKDLINMNGGEKGVADLVEAINNMGGSTKVLSVATRKSMNRGLAKAVKETWVNSLLSSPKTQAINIASNAFTAILRPIERGVGAALSKGGADSIPKGEMMAMYQGMIGGIFDAFAMAKTAWDTGESAFRGSRKFLLDKTPIAGSKQYDNAISSTSFNLDEASVFGRFLDFMGPILNAPTRALESADEFFKAINYRAELHAQAYRKAHRNKIDLGLSEADFQKQVQEFMKNPDETIQMKSLEAARESTFTKPLDEVNLRGFEAEVIDDFIRRTPILKIVTPFTKTNLNLVEYALNRSPFAKGLADDIAAGGARRDTALGRVAVGSSFMMLGAGLATNGIITGRGPVDRRAQIALRDIAGWQPYSIKVGDKYYSYDRLEPFGSLIGMAADYAEIAGAWNRDEEDLTALAVQTAVITAQFFTPEFITRNLLDFGDVLRGDEYKTQQFISGAIRGLVPMGSALNEVNKFIDPVKRSRRPDKNSAFSVWDRISREIRSMIPGLSDELPPIRNIFGEAIKHYSLAQTPEDIEPFQEAKGDAISKFIQQFNETADDIFADDEEYEMFKIDMPSDRFVWKGSVYKLSPEQYDRYVQLSAGLEEGFTLREALNQEIEDDFPSLGNYPRSMKGMTMALKQIIFEYREMAKEKLIEEDIELEDAIIENKERFDTKLEKDIDLEI